MVPYIALRDPVIPNGGPPQERRRRVDYNDVPTAEVANITHSDYKRLIVRFVAFRSERLFLLSVSSQNGRKEGARCGPDGGGYPLALD